MPDASAKEGRRQTKTRAFNEWIEDANESMGLAGAATFRCECGDGACSHRIPLTHAEYELVRSYPTRFAIAPNHENPESDRVVEEHERYSVVEKLVGPGSRRAQRSYPR